MPILREEIQAFARLWNIHQIRKQPNRPSSVQGKPFMLYNFPKEPVRNYGIKPDDELLQKIRNHYLTWGMFYY